MAVERKKHFAVDKLSPAGRALVDAMLGDNATYDDVVKALAAKTGERLALSSLQRYHANRFVKIREKLEQTEHIYSIVKESLKGSAGKNIEEVTGEAAKALLFNVVSNIDNPDPYALYDIVLAKGRLDVQRDRNKILQERTGNDKKKIELLERTVAAKEKQIEAAREKAVAAEKKIETIGRRKGLDAETLKKIREEVYGIVEAPV